MLGLANAIPEPVITPAPIAGRQAFEQALIGYYSFADNVCEFCHQPGSCRDVDFQQTRVQNVPSARRGLLPPRMDAAAQLPRFAQLATILLDVQETELCTATDFRRRGEFAL